jgi:hypothetical protein
VRYYDLSILNPQGQLLASTNAGFVPSTNGLPTFSSRIRQQHGVPINNPGALNIEFDIPVVGYALPQGGSWVRISGVGLRTIGQASNLNADYAAGRGLASFILSAGLHKLRGRARVGSSQFRSGAKHRWHERFARLSGHQ